MLVPSCSGANDNSGSIVVYRLTKYVIIVSTRKPDDTTATGTAEMKRINKLQRKFYV